VNTNPRYSPNYENYKKKDIWKLQDAVCLLINVNPLEKERAFYNDKKIKGVYLDILDTAEKAEDRRMFVERDYYSAFRDAEVWPEKFIKWANSKGYEIPEPLLYLPEYVEEKNVTNKPSNDEEPQSQLQVIETGNKIDQRVKDIGLLANIWFLDTMKIPDGGKKQLGETLCELKPKLFTESTFKKAWHEAINQKIVNMENHEQFNVGK